MGYIKGAYEWQTKNLPLHHVVIRNVDTKEETIVTSGNVTIGYSDKVAQPYGNKIEAYFYFETVTEDMKLCFWDGVNLQFEEVTNKTIYYDYASYPPKKTIVNGNGLISAGSICGAIASSVNNLVICQGSNIFRVNIDDAVESGYAVYRAYVPNTVLNPESNIATETQVTLYNVENLLMQIRYCKIPTELKTLYPFDVYVKNTKAITFEWDNSIPAPYYEGQRRDNAGDGTLLNVSNVLKIWDAEGTEKNITLPGSNESYELSVADLSDFSVGDIHYKLTSIANNDFTLSLEESFILVGQTDAPDIISVSQDNFPTVNWNCSNQISWQMVIKQGDELIYDSGMKAGNIQSFKVPVFVENGAYSIEMRALNRYGLYTGWNSMSFNLNPAAPSAPTGIIASPNSHYGITVSCIVPTDAGTLYVVRRDNADSKAIVLGEYYEGFTDYNVALNKSYEYSVRNYLQGCADGPYIDGTVRATGAVIRDPEDKLNYIKISMSEREFDVIKTESKSDTLFQCIGRKYPIAELGEWITSQRDFVGYVSDEDYSKLVNIKLNRKSIYLQIDNEVIPCYLSFSDNGAYVSGGRNLKFSVTRIDGE